MLSAMAMHGEGIMRAIERSAIAVLIGCVGNKSDKIDARKLAELLRADLLSPVYWAKSGCAC